MSHFRFPSIAHPAKYGYAFDSSAWNGGSDSNPSFRQYETYGDGLTQHSGDWSVTLEYLADYLYSLGAAMQTNDELTDAVSFVITRQPDSDRIAFAASVVWKESDNHWDKRRYYSTKLLKVGGRAKEHDNRFQAITTHEDGSRASIFRLITSEYACGLERFQNALAVGEWAANQKKFVEQGERFPEWFGGDYSKHRQLRDALGVCRSIADALRGRKLAESMLEHYLHSVTVALKAASEETPESLAS